MIRLFHISDLHFGLEDTRALLAAAAVAPEAGKRAGAGAAGYSTSFEDEEGEEEEDSDAQQRAAGSEPGRVIAGGRRGGYPDGVPVGLSGFLLPQDLRQRGGAHGSDAPPADLLKGVKAAVAVYRDTSEQVELEQNEARPGRARLTETGRPNLSAAVNSPATYYPPESAY